MNANHRHFLRYVMLTAWRLRRTDPDRAFADCLRAGWAHMKALRAEPSPAIDRFLRAARRGGGHVALSPLVGSPIQRSLRGARYGGALDRKAAYLTARVGY